MQKNYQAVYDNRGFTLIELLIAMAVGSMIMFAVYKIYVAHQRTYTAQLAVTEMQQNMRVAIDLLSSDIRMAGYATSGNPAGAGIVTATPDLFSFASDLNENGTVDTAGDPGERVAYDQYLSKINGVNVPVLGRSESGGVHQPAAENVEHLRFRYLSSLDPAPNGTVAAFTSDIRFVLVDIVVRAGQEDPDFRNTQTYTAADGTIFGGAAKNDGFRRRQQTFTVQCRNVN